MYIEESFDTIFNMGYGWGNRPWPKGFRVAARNVTFLVVRPLRSYPPSTLVVTFFFYFKKKFILSGPAIDVLETSLGPAFTPPLFLSGLNTKKKLFLAASLIMSHHTLVLNKRLPQTAPHSGASINRVNKP